jgi:hypothetical protein
MNSTPSYQLRFIVSPQVLPANPSRLHPRIALTRPGGARVKVGGAVPLAEPELSLPCSETMRNRRTYQSDISMYLGVTSIGRPIPSLSICRAWFGQLGFLGRLPAGNSDRSESNRREPTWVILRILRSVVKQILQKMPRK